MQRDGEQALGEARREAAEAREHVEHFGHREPRPQRVHLRAVVEHAAELLGAPLAQRHALHVHLQVGVSQLMLLNDPVTQVRVQYEYPYNTRTILSVSMSVSLHKFEYEYCNVSSSYSATGGSLVSDDELHSRRLAGAVRAEKSEQLVLPHGQTHGAQRDSRLTRSAAAAAALLRAAARQAAAASDRKLAARLVQHHRISRVLQRPCILVLV